MNKRFRVYLSDGNELIVYEETATRALKCVRKEYLLPKVFNGEDNVPTVEKIERMEEWKDESIG